MKVTKLKIFVDWIPKTHRERERERETNSSRRRETKRERVKSNNK